MNFYGVLSLIVVVGLLSVAWARYEYRHPASAATKTPPTIGTTWFAALGISACGVQQPALAANPTAPGGFLAIPGGVIEVAPLTAAEAGNNATLNRFVSAYPGLTVSSKELAVPASRAHPKTPTVWKTGDTCAKGTTDAGRVGQVEIAYWKNFAAQTPQTTTDPSSVKFSPNMLISLVFAPTGTTPPKPPKSAISAMLNATPPSTTTTTLPIATTTLHTTTTTAKH
jgi:hypothetical protein